MTPITAESARHIEHQPRSKGRWRAVTAVLILLGLVPAMFVLLQGDPVVVLMDTNAPGGVYEESRKLKGGTNAEDLAEVLQPLLPKTLAPFQLSSDWRSEEQVLAKRPKLIVIHRSSFFHPLNAEFKLATNEVNWATLYEAGDERMKSFIGYIGSQNLKTKFLVYSRGTDPNWLKAGFQERWVEEIETRYPKLRGRISTMAIEGGKTGSFKNEKTAAQVRAKVKKILHLRDKN
jgi:hypothetical protein